MRYDRSYIFHRLIVQDDIQLLLDQDHVAREAQAGVVIYKISEYLIYSSARESGTPQQGFRMAFGRGQTPYRNRPAGQFQTPPQQGFRMYSQRNDCLCDY